MVGINDTLVEIINKECLLKCESGRQSHILVDYSKIYFLVICFSLIVGYELCSLSKAPL